VRYFAAIGFASSSVIISTPERKGGKGDPYKYSKYPPPHPDSSLGLAASS
jgi:hypothetical protein